MVTYEVRRDPSAPRSTIVDTPHLTRNRSRKRKKRGAKKGADADKPTTSDASDFQKLEPEEISQDAIEESISPLPEYLSQPIYKLQTLECTPKSKCLIYFLRKS